MLGNMSVADGCEIMENSLAAREDFAQEKKSAIYNHKMNEMKHNAMAWKEMICT